MAEAEAVVPACPPEVFLTIDESEEDYHVRIKARDLRLLLGERAYYQCLLSK